MAIGARRATKNMHARRAALLIAATVSADGDGFRTMSLFIGRSGEDSNAHGSPVYAGCSKSGSCDTPGRWHSQASQDRIVLKAVFQGKRDGYFVDLAANHPILKSNTRALERDYGWRGLCIDGNEEFLMLLLKRRKCEVIGAIVSSEANGEVMYRRWHGVGGSGSTGSWQHALSGIVGFDNKANVTDDPLAKKLAGGHRAKGPSAEAGFRDVRSISTRLQDILHRSNAPSTIDYLSLDVEGAEEAVMRLFPFQTYTFLAWTIERPSDALQNLVASHGYVFVAEMPGNFGEKLFLHSSLPGGVDAARVRVQALMRDMASESALRRAG